MTAGLMWRTLLLSVALATLATGQGRAQPLQRGDAIVTAFPGFLTERRDGSGAAFPRIDTRGASARIMSLAAPGFVWDGRVFRPGSSRSVSAARAGLLFGVAVDDEKFANVYFAATSAFGLHIVAPDASGRPARVPTGRPGAAWMAGQWGRDGGPGSIWRLNGRTGKLELFANIALDGAPNSGPALGNIAFDAAHGQLFVSDRDTGMIHRLDKNGRELGIFDHGVSGRRAAGLAPLPFDPANRLDIASADFDSADPGTWALAAPKRRVWGLAAHGGRLYYAVARGERTRFPQIWSVGLDRRSGAFLADARLELTLPSEGTSDEISDIAFTREGAMILAQRGRQMGGYDFRRFARDGRARVLRYWLESPDDPATPSRWIARPEEYAVGFRGEYRNAHGGLALGYGYSEKGVINRSVCEGALWTTGGGLRDNPALREKLAPGGPLALSGLQGAPARPVRPFNAPPWSAYFIDQDGRPDAPEISGWMGDVEIFTPGCGAAGASLAGLYTPWNYPEIDGWTYGEDLPPACTYEDGCAQTPAPAESACMSLVMKSLCNAKGQAQVNLGLVSSANGFSPDALKISTATPGVSLPGGPVASFNPLAEIPLSGAAPGAPVTLSLCAFDSARMATGKPFTCCRATITIKTPAAACKGDQK